MKGNPDMEISSTDMMDMLDYFRGVYDHGCLDIDMGKEDIDEYCPKCGEKMLVNYMCDEGQFSGYYVCEDCPIEEEEITS
jgi:predicted RNA-binding Zn-ribbon protein involved in translation (DUF1610 family)